MASGENAGTEAANGEGLNVTTEQAFTFTMLRAMQLMFIMGTEQPKAETQEHVHETIRARGLSERRDTSSTRRIRTAMFKRASFGRARSCWEAAEPLTTRPKNRRATLPASARP